MTYASAKNHLKDKLGHPYFAEELHITSKVSELLLLTYKAEFNYAHYQGEKKPVDSRSAFEKEHESVVFIFDFV